MVLLGRLFTVLVGLLLIIGQLNHAAYAKKRHRHHHPSTYHRLSPAHAIYGSQNLADELNEIVNSAGGRATVGVQVKSMKTGSILYSHNETTLLTPASTLKILTAEAALIYLGPNYKFTTRLMTNAKSTSGGIIDGDIYLIHSGDPSLTYYDLTDLMVALKAEQIQGINGNVYVDNTAYDQNNFGPGWMWEDTRYCYAAPINASIINHNCISVEITPAKTVGSRAIVLQNPRFFYSGIDNSVSTKPAGTRSCHLSINSSADNIITIDGCMPKGRYSRGGSVVINNITKYNEALLKRLFQRFGISITGIVSSKAAPSNLTLLASHESKPLHMLINEMLKKSDNIIAGSLFKKLGSLYSNEPGSWANGSTAVKEILADKASVNTSRMRALDGSGLSLNNQVTAAQMMQVLDHAYHNYATNYEFISALPIAGIDGTLKGRLHNVTGKVRAKTGTMALSGIIGLTGYAMSKDHEPIAFVVLVNGHNGSTWQYREVIDRIVTALVNYSRG